MTSPEQIAAQEITILLVEDDPPTLWRTQAQAEPPAGPELNTAKLTPREIDILWGIAKGFSYAEIATHLGMSKQTVPGHIKSIYRKLEVHTRGEAVFEAVQQGLIKL